MNTAVPQHLCGQFTLSPRPQLHMARRWACTVHASVRRKKLDKTYTFAYSAFCCRLFGHLFNVVVSGFNTRMEVILDKDPCGFGRQLLLIF